MPMMNCNLAKNCINKINLYHFRSKHVIEANIFVRCKSQILLNGPTKGLESLTRHKFKF